MRFDGHKGRVGFLRGAIGAIALFSMELVAPASALAEEARDGPSIDLKVYDAVFLRPLYFTKFVVGTAAYILSLPLPFFLGDDAVLDDSWEIALRGPVRDVFERPLGDL